LRPVEFQSLFQAVESSEFNVSKTLGLAIHLVLNEANTGHRACRKKVLDIGLSDFEGEIAEMSGERRLGR